MAIAMILGMNFALAVMAVILLWLVCMAIKDPTPMDSFWAFGLLMVALATYLETGGGTDRRLVILALSAIWAVRLGTYLLWRWRHHGPDPRYDVMMRKAKERRGWSYAYASLRLVFLTQAPMLWLTSLPVQLGQMTDGPDPMGALAFVGIGLSAFGIVFESIGDWQLVRFKADPANKGLVMDQGLWRYTRHPNYFGDACVWWGLFLIGAENMPGWFALPGPIFLTYTLLVWSGAALLERRLTRAKPGYADYLARTSAFIPWFPKRMSETTSG